MLNVVIATPDLMNSNRRLNCYLDFPFFASLIFYLGYFSRVCCVFCKYYQYLLGLHIIRI